MMIDAQATREFLEVYLVSNTPLYLFKRLRRLPAAQQLARALSGEELAAEYLRRTKAQNRTPDDVAIAYACLIAITHKDPPEAVSVLRSLDLTGLAWAPAIRDLFTAKVPAGRSHYITITAPAVPSVHFGTDATTSSGSTDVPRPRIQRKVNL
jgi:hypothetical protein